MMAKCEILAECRASYAIFICRTHGVDNVGSPETNGGFCHVARLARIEAAVLALATGAPICVRDGCVDAVRMQ
jgi:hypothetical protein